MYMNYEPVPKELINEGEKIYFRCTGKCVE